MGISWEGRRGAKCVDGLLQTRGGLAAPRFTNNGRQFEIMFGGSMTLVDGSQN